MRAVVLAGGRGTRLLPYTVVLPKPLMPIGEYPILEVIVRQLAACGFDHLTMAVNHQAEIIKAFFGHGEKWGIRVDYSLEKMPLSTMGPLKLIGDLPDDFLVMNGDVLTDLDYAELYRHHVERRSIFTISAFAREERSEYGVLDVGPAERLVGFREKPVTRHEVSMGVYVVSKRVLELIPEGRAYGFDHLMLDLIASGQHPSVRRYAGYWLDIGRQDDYMQAIDEFDSKKSHLLPKNPRLMVGAVA
jgi:NDP-sugar pyrophosphorylase family protein